MYQVGLLTMSISTTLLPVGKGYPELVLYALVFGLGEACFVVLIPLVTKEVVGIRRLSPALGSLFMIMAIPTMLGPPVAGEFNQIFIFIMYDKVSLRSRGVVSIMDVLLFLRTSAKRYLTVVLRISRQRRRRMAYTSRFFKSRGHLCGEGRFFVTN